MPVPFPSLKALAVTDAKKNRTSELSEILARLAAIEERLKIEPKVRPNPAGEGETRYCSLPQVPERTFGPEVSSFRESLIRYIGKKWVNGTKLRFYFFGSGPFSSGNDQKELVREGFEVWKDVGIGITFEEVSDVDEAEIRIGFLQGDGAWSYVGRDVVDIPGQYERTMNFGWDLTRDPRGVDVPVHEIGHTLGFPHEHQNPFAGIVWDEEAVYRHFAGDPNRWDRQTTYHNVLRKLGRGEVEGSTWDPDSIMHYGFDAGLILQPPQYRSGLEPAGGLSQKDVDQARLFYPPLPGNSENEELKPLRSVPLSLGPAQQKNFSVKPTATRTYKFQTVGRSDTVMVLFEDQSGDLKYVKGDDDSGTDRNAQFSTRLYKGRKYVLRIRLYSNHGSGDTAVLMS